MVHCRLAQSRQSNTPHTHTQSHSHTTPSPPPQASHHCVRITHVRILVRTLDMSGKAKGGETAVTYPPMASFIKAMEVRHVQRAHLCDHIPLTVHQVSTTCLPPIVVAVHE
jgi:hypothetical protein